MTATEAGFALDPRLAADTLPIGDLGLSRVLLMNDARFPWLILVPRRADVREVIDLTEADQQRLLQEIAQCSQVLRAMTRPDKLNIAALGNVVAQLHVHVIARFKTDVAWPRPVWGVGSGQVYSAAELSTRMSALHAALNLAST
ncbi:MAG: HIT domain-containing protein [Rudaea sp.]